MLILYALSLIRSMPMIGDFPKRSIVAIGNKAIKLLLFTISLIFVVFYSCNTFNPLVKVFFLLLNGSYL